jgi:hypothetical protein
MQKTQGSFITLMLGSILLCLLSACSGPTNAMASSPASKPTVAPTGKASTSVTATQTLRNVATAMKKTKYYHLKSDIQSTVKPGAQSSFPVQTISTTTTVEGDIIQPDQASLHTVVTASTTQGKLTSITEIKVGHKLYIQNPNNQQWAVVNMGSSADASGSSGDYDRMLLLSQKGNITDHGENILNGQKLRHITVVLNSSALKDLMNSSSGLFRSLSSRQFDVNKLMKSITFHNATEELWIDETTAHLVQTELKVDMAMNMAALLGSSATNASMPPFDVTSDEVVLYSKYDVPVTITVPAKAIPASNILSAVQ